MLILTRMITDEQYNTIFEVLDTDDYTIVPINDIQFEELAKKEECPDAITFSEDSVFPIYSVETTGYFRRDTKKYYFRYLNVFLWGDWCAVSYTNRTLFWYKHRYVDTISDSITCICPLSLYKFICDTQGNNLMQLTYHPVSNKLAIKTDLFNEKELSSTKYYQGGTVTDAQIEFSFPKILKKDKMRASKLLYEERVSKLLYKEHMYLDSNVTVFRNRETGNRFISRITRLMIDHHFDNVVRCKVGNEYVDKIHKARTLDINNLYLKQEDIDDKNIQLRLPIIANEIKFKMLEIYKRLVYSVYLSEDEILKQDYEIPIFWYILNNIFIKQRQYLIDNLRVIDCKFYPQRIANFAQIDLSLRFLCSNQSKSGSWVYGYMNLAEIGIQEVYNAILSKSRG